MPIYKNKFFARFAAKARITNLQLCNAVSEAERGLIDADLGGGVIKKRIARERAGKSGGFRTLILFKAQHRAFFIYGFAKSDRDNISTKELQALKKLAATLLSARDEVLATMVTQYGLIQVNCNGKEISKPNPGSGP